MIGPKDLVGADGGGGEGEGEVAAAAVAEVRMTMEEVEALLKGRTDPEVVAHRMLEAALPLHRAMDFGGEVGEGGGGGLEA